MMNTKTNVKEMDLDQLMMINGGDGADEVADTTEETAAAPARQRRRVRRFRNIVINGKMKQVAFWTWEYLD